MQYLSHSTFDRINFYYPGSYYIYIAHKRSYDDWTLYRVLNSRLTLLKSDPAKASQYSKLMMINRLGASGYSYGVRIRAGFCFRLLLSPEYSTEIVGPKYVTIELAVTDRNHP